MRLAAVMWSLILLWCCVLVIRSGGIAGGTCVRFHVTWKFAPKMVITSDYHKQMRGLQFFQVGDDY